jgi:hypothetical protein
MKAVSFGLRVVLLSVAVAALWLLGAPSAYAHHHRFLAENADYLDTNPPDPPAASAPYYSDPTYTWARQEWTLGSAPTYYCDGLASGAAEDAIADWVSHYTTWPINPVLRARCGTGQTMDIVNDVSWSGFPCGAGAVSCVEPSWYYDITAGGYYFNYTRIWVNMSYYNSYTYNGMRSTIAHELGHTFGLDEAYFEANFGCDYSSTSIMNTASINGRQVTGGCNGAVGPSQSDVNDVQAFYVMASTPYQPQNLTSLKGTTNSMVLYWNDASPTESFYNMFRYYWTGSSWHQYVAYPRPASVARGDSWVPSQLNETVTRPPSLPVTWYLSCMQMFNGIIGYRYWFCFPYQWLGS